ncbi:MAG: hypothetical protein IPH50_05635 [Rhodanobacteraceae bacterium]|nr:hypothetical protein [Rhodanobacteraceae bacterium]
MDSKISEHAVEQLLHIDEHGWAREFEAIADYLDEFGTHTPARLREEAARIAAQLPSVEQKVA